MGCAAGARGCLHVVLSSVIECWLCMGIGAGMGSVSVNGLLSECSSVADALVVLPVYVCS
jgi:hypothetical protein